MTSSKDTYNFLDNVKGHVSNSVVNAAKIRDIERKNAAAHKLEYPSEHAKRTKLLSKLENDIIIYLNKNYRKQQVTVRNGSVRIETKHIA